MSVPELCGKGNVRPYLGRADSGKLYRTIAEGMTGMCVAWKQSDSL